MKGSLLTAAVAACLVAAGLAVPVAAGDSASSTASDLIQRVGPERVARHAATGQLRFVSGTSERPLATNAELGGPTTPRGAARRFMDRYGAAFGIAGPRDLRVARTGTDGTGRTFVRYQQLHRGVPVLGGEISVQVDADLDVISANGEASVGLRVDTQPTITAGDALRTAKRAIAKRHGVKAADLTATVPALWVYDPALMGGRALPFARLVWRMDVTSPGADFREVVLVDAHHGVVALHFDQIGFAKNRITCNGEDDVTISANNFPCTVARAERTETSGATGVADIDLAHQFAGHTYDFYFNRFARDSLDGLGLQLKSTVRYCPNASNCPDFENAFWNGSQMAYGDGFASADDVVGHELTHGVTEFTSRLFYYYQSGAINEALSDIFGELMDLTNGAGTDNATTRWQLGEDLPPAFGVIRDMQDPPSLGQPDRMQHSNYTADTFEGDGGGVHTNSGVANKAAYLMVDGETFNGQTVAGFGIDKTAAIWYRVETQYLGSASDYADLGSALNQACADLIGITPKNASGSPSIDGAITAANCTNVGKAVLATEMALQPTAAPAPHVARCPSGSPTNVFFDDLENTASGNWTTAGSGAWFYPQNPNPYTDWDPTYATSGDTNFWGDDPGTATDSTIRMTNAVTIPAGGFLHFAHAYGFEDGFDGGRVEYQIGAGSFIDAGSLPVVNGYNGTPSAFAGGTAFTNESNGYIQSRFDLSSLAGQSVRFRFRIATDSSVGDYGWFIDDIRIYSCSTGTTLQPDGLIRVGAGADVGNNIYNLTAVGQSKSKKSAAGSTITFNITVQNDGLGLDTFKLQGGGNAAGYTVKYFDGVTDITAQVAAGTYTTPGVPPGASYPIRVTVKVKSTAAVGSKVTRVVTITSNVDPVKKDAVKFSGKRL